MVELELLIIMIEVVGVSEMLKNYVRSKMNIESHFIYGYIHSSASVFSQDRDGRYNIA